MIKIFSDDLKTGFSHFISWQIDSRDSLDSQQYFDLFSTLLTKSVFAEVYHLQTAHIDDSAEKLSEGVFVKALSL